MMSKTPIDIELRLADEQDMMVGWCMDPGCLEQIRDEYYRRNGNLQTADLEFIDDILAIVWEYGMLQVGE